MKETKKPESEQAKQSEQQIVKQESYLQPTEYLNPDIWKQMQGMAKTFVDSGALPPDENPAKVAMKMQAGFEMGMKPIEAVKSFYFVKGTINIFGSALMRRLREHGWQITFKDEPNKCTVTAKKGSETYTDSLTFEEAEKSKWTRGQSGLKPGWYEGANRKLKLRYGATSMLIKTYLPEVLGSATDIAEVAEDYPIDKGEVPRAGDDEPATPDQLDALKAMEIDTPEGLTKGEATKLMTNRPTPIKATKAKFDIKAVDTSKTKEDAK